MRSKEVIKARLEAKKQALDEANKAYIAILKGGVKSYAIGSRNLSKFDLPQIEDTIKKLEKEVDELEGALRGIKPRRIVGVVPRDF